MTKVEAAEIANEHFKSYPTVNQFFITTDGQAFERKHDAENHAKSFQLPANQVVRKVTREEGADEDAVAVTVNNPVVVLPAGTVVKIDSGGNTEGHSDYKLTADDFDKNPSLAEQGLKEGDIVKIPAKEIDVTGADLANVQNDHIAPKTPEQLEKIEAAKIKLAEATKQEADRSQAYNDAPANMRGVAKAALNKAQTTLQEAKDELAKAQEDSK